jgi:hypothetical protein
MTPSLRDLLNTRIVGRAVGCHTLAPRLPAASLHEMAPANFNYQLQQPELGRVIVSRLCFMTALRVVPFFADLGCLALGIIASPLYLHRRSRDARAHS